MNTETILIVDDDLASLRLLMEILTAEGYQVRPADSGELALAAVEAQPPTLILLDLLMPGMDGFEVLRRIKAREKSRAIPVIFLSAATETEHRVAGFKLGAVDFVSKPFQRDELLARVQTHLELFRLRTQLEQRAAELQSINERLLIAELAERKRSENALHESEQLLKLIIDTLPVGVWLMDAQGTVVSANPAGQQIWAGIRSVDIDHLEEYKAWRLDSNKQIEAREWAGARAVEKGETSLGEEIEIECFDGTHKIILNSALPIRGSDGRIKGAIVVNQDITARKAAEDEIKHLAFHDLLTQLPNRRLLLDRLHQAMAASARNGREGALLFIDLDHFKILNDTLGHHYGDLLLQQVAARLITCVREGDTVARLGGDEFVVMLEDLSGNPQEAAAQARIVGEKILATLNQPYWLSSYEHHSTPSIGVALFSDHRETVEQLFKRADLAMYEAKMAGRNALRFYVAVP
ncbi:GGDEF domain-containing response regulator [Candidatus Contendibacter odensensis]|uniref:Diguanylate cyclase n=1 Tax=Candidatus Contendobacter odensis Run_B_J11 TaxID=1400861 RepID=A0A7U7J1J2_9GAMM|nr:diguanylate cyclase [Candidatus Contendobacter odensis]CDH43357.1 putative Diguanylate cyclase [Candidatus Contendobacter odensis Run_B_J11]